MAHTPTITYRCDNCGKMVEAKKLPKGWRDATTRKDLFKKLHCPDCRTDRP